MFLLVFLHDLVSSPNQHSSQMSCRHGCSLHLYCYSLSYDVVCLYSMQKTQHAESAPLSSIVIYPPTLTGHWVFEIEKFCSRQYLNPLHYTGPPTERQLLRSKVKKHNLVVVSYDIVRNDIDFFRTIQWNYCILDEGHIIKNGKTKLAKAIKQLSAGHRLILSGTPIQVLYPVLMVPRLGWGE